jgi:hypothetical protein
MQPDPSTSAGRRQLWRMAVGHRPARRTFHARRRSRPATAAVAKGSATSCRPSNSGWTSATTSEPGIEAGDANPIVHKRITGCVQHSWGRIIDAMAATPGRSPRRNPVAEAIRVELARRRIAQRELADILKISTSGLLTAHAVGKADPPSVWPDIGRMLSSRKALHFRRRPCELACWWWSRLGSNQ